MAGYVSVPVPEHLVSEVMAIVTDRLREESRAAAATLAPTVAAPDETETSRNWTREQLMLLRDSDAPSVVLFSKVLDALAAVSPEPGDIRSIAEGLGYEPLRLKNSFGPVTRWMRNRNELGEDARWPIHFPNGEWAMNEHNAELWKAINEL